MSKVPTVAFGMAAFSLMSCATIQMGPSKLSVMHHATMEKQQETLQQMSHAANEGRQKAIGSLFSFECYDSAAISCKRCNLSSSQGSSMRCECQNVQLSTYITFKTSHCI
jgi:uncharacterized paraquat-inducible protein A